MKSHSKKTFIKAAIMDSIPYLGNEFKSGWLVTMVTDRMNTTVYPDTILRYLRELKADGRVDYICTDRKNMVYQLTNKTE